MNQSYDNIKNKLLASSEQVNVATCTKIYTQILFTTLITKFNFRANKYNFCGSYDLSHWICLCFNTIMKSQKEQFEQTILPLIAYLSIVDDACDERIDDISINEMKKHIAIFEGKQIEVTNPAHRMGLDVYERLSQELRLSPIIYKSLEFLKIGVGLIEKTKQASESGMEINNQDLEGFLFERRVDSMASLFFVINNIYNNVESTHNPSVIRYSELASDIISIINDVASLAKDVENKVTNNFVIMSHGLENNISVGDLAANSSVTTFEITLNLVLRQVESMITEMETTRSSDPSLEFQTIDEVLKGYCTWCFTSKRFKRMAHILPDFIPEPPAESTGSTKVNYFKYDDMDKYLEDEHPINNKL